jgi:protein required for attachment to host cells
MRFISKGDKMPRTYWIIVADCKRARLLSKVETTDGLDVLREFINQPDNRRPGELAGGRFAEDLAQLLERSANRGGYDRLVLVATDDFLPLLSKALGPQSAARLAWSMLQDMTKLKLDELECLFDEMIGVRAEAVMA